VSLDYAVPGVFTDLGAVPRDLLVGVATRPLEICAPVHGLVLQPTDGLARGLPAARHAENQLRPADEIVRRLIALDPTPLHLERAPASRVIGTCRHFAVLACALLRHRRVEARVRCGFATYFQPGQALDHWIVEYRDSDSDGWVRVDAEILGGTVLAHPDRLEPGQFLAGGEAWLAFRRGDVDPSTFGVHGTENWGAAEIRGNAVKDLAALNKVEMLPWDEWGRMTAAYEGRTGPDYDELLDRLAAICSTDDPAAIERLSLHEDLRVPVSLMR
jgi:hypothetical protein